jgi:hypothetical protein
MASAQEPVAAIELGNAEWRHPAQSNATAGIMLGTLFLATEFIRIPPQETLLTRKLLLASRLSSANNPIRICLEIQKYIVSAEGSANVFVLN